MYLPPQEHITSLLEKSGETAHVSFAILSFVYSLGIY